MSGDRRQGTLRQAQGMQGTGGRRQWLGVLGVTVDFGDAGMAQRARGPSTYGRGDVFLRTNVSRGVIRGGASAGRAGG